MKKIYFLLITCLSCTIQSQAQIPSYVASKGLVGWWPFTGNAIDSSTYDNDGTVYGALLTTDRFGSANSAYEFDGIDDFIDLDSAGLSANPDTFSASAWFLVDEIPIDGRDHYRHGVVLTKRHDEYNSWSTIEVNEDSNLALNVDGPFKANKIMPDFNVINEQWHHVVIMKEDTNYTIILDNKLVKKDHDGYKHAGLDNHMHVGHHGGWYSFYDGKIDDIGIWNRALTTQEITALYEAKTRETAITELENNHYILFPNPAHDFIVLKNNSSMSGAAYTVNDITGAVVIRGTMKSAEETINIRILSSGTYLLQVEGMRQPLKIIKQ